MSLFRFVNKPFSALAYRNIHIGALAYRNIHIGVLAYRTTLINTPSRNMSTKNSIENKLKNTTKETPWYKIRKEKKNDKNTIFGHLTNAAGAGFIAEEILGLIFVALFGVYLLWEEDHPILAILAGITLLLILSIMV